MEVGPAANQFAYIALLSWPAICVLLFVMLPIEAAAIWSMLGAYLLLPANLTIHPALLPPLDRMSIAAITTMLLCSMKGTEANWRRPSFFVYLFGAGFVVSPILTSLGNSYELHTAAGSIPGFYPLDGVKIAARQMIALLPFFVGMRFLSNEKGRAQLLKSLPIALLFYSVPMIFEVRFSPQLHRWAYGYHPSEFIQQVRGGGFRPVVFVGHGLELALFTCFGFLMSLILLRARWKVLRLPTAAVATYLGLLLLLCKSLGPAIYAVFLAPILFFTRPRTWVKISCVLLLFVCAYPVLRWHSLVPVEQIANVANKISPDRSESFDVRVTNENQLLTKANEKPLFGWGTWGRNRIYDENTGKDLSITDGEWIIQFGTYGWFGYLALFGLLTIAAFRAYGAVGDKVTPGALTLAGLTLLLAVQVVDMLPNGSTMSMTFLIAGSVAASAKVGRPRRSERSMWQGSRSPIAASP